MELKAQDYTPGCHGTDEAAMHWTQPVTAKVANNSEWTRTAVGRKDEGPTPKDETLAGGDDDVTVLPGPAERDRIEDVTMNPGPNNGRRNESNQTTIPLREHELPSDTCQEGEGVDSVARDESAERANSGHNRTLARRAAKE